LRFPGTKEGWNTLQDTTDAELFGRATLWALDEDKARNEIFNVSNGDVYRWRQLWKELAAFYDLLVAEPLAMSTVSEMSEKAPLWGFHGYPLRPARHALRTDCKLGLRGLDAQLPRGNNPEHNQDSAGRLCGLHRDTPQL
jgi:nucleoside-diphosphate-sugar epimerase